MWNKQKRRTLLIFGSLCECHEWVNMNLLVENSISCSCSLEEAAVGALESSALWDSIVLTHRGHLIGSQWMAITIYHKPNAQTNSQLNYYCRSCLSLVCACSYHSETNINTNNMFTQEKEMNSCIHDSQTQKQIHIWTHSDICTRSIIWTQRGKNTHGDSSVALWLWIHAACTADGFSRHFISTQGLGKRCLQRTQPLWEYRIWLMPSSSCLCAWTCVL